MIGYEARSARWVLSRLGEPSMSPQERIRRLTEEVAEAAQAEGIPESEVHTIVSHVFSREPGRNYLEAGGVAFCLFAWCASRGWRALDLVRAELERIERKPDAEIQGSVARKAAAGLVVG
jgi:hypothetical protein